MRNYPSDDLTDESCGYVLTNFGEIAVGKGDGK